MGNVLVVYFSPEYPRRAALTDHIFCFRRHTPHRCFYLNVARRRTPSFVASVDFDVVVFHTTFLSYRTAPEHFRRLCDRIAPLRGGRAVKAVLPQDEHINTDVLGEFIRDFGVGVVYSCAAESEWPKLYPSVDRDAVVFRTVLTGYLESGTLERIEGLRRENTSRDLDIGYRAWDAWPSLGRHGRFKGDIGRLFEREGTRRGLRVDISVDLADTILGDEWYRFLLRCRFTPGVEGGSSILDADGSLMRRTLAYRERYPDAGFDEIEAACFPGAEGTLDYFALSPRHLEACATRTCQILVEGRYSGVLVPGVHYLELKKDLSNVAEVFEQMADEERRVEMVDRAYADVVASGSWRYREFASSVIDECLLMARSARRVTAGASTRGTEAGERVLLSWARALDESLWGRKAVRSLALSWFRKLLGPDKAAGLLGGLVARRRFGRKAS